MSDFRGDVLLYSTEDGGEIELTNYGLITNTGGFETAVYLTLFGGNDLDNGTESTKKYQFWGNLTENDNPNRKLTSRTQNILRGLPAVPANLLKLEEAIKLDMQWFFEEKIIDTLNIDVSIPSKNRADIELQGLKDKTKIFDLKYNQNWLEQIT